MSALAKALQTIATSGDSVKLEKLAADVGLAVAAIEGAFDVLRPFGAIQLEQGSARRATEQAGRFLESLSDCLKNNFSYGIDWQRLGGADYTKPNEIFDKGTCLVAAVERLRRRSKGDPAPLRSVRAVTTVIKAQARSKECYYLSHRDDKARRYQFIGGQIRPDETPEQAMIRELNEEVPGNHFEFGKNVTLDQAPNFEVKYSDISPTYGLYTHYTLNIFKAQFDDVPDLSAGHKWLTIDELRKGRADDNVLILPPPAILEQMEPWLARTSPSFEKRIDLPTKRATRGFTQRVRAGIAAFKVE